MPEDIVKIKQTAHAARECWQELWPGWKRSNGHPQGHCASSGTCVPTSFALAIALRRTAGGWTWNVVGGRPTKRTPTGGFWLNGNGGAHLWVKGRNANRHVIVDITADQFGAPPVLVLANTTHHAENATKELLRRYEENESFTTSLWSSALLFSLGVEP